MNFDVKRLFLFALVPAAVIVLLNGRLHAEPGPLNFSYSYSCYAGTPEKTAIEFVFKFSENGLTYREGYGRLMIEFGLYDSSGRLLENYLWTVDHFIDEKGPQQKVFGGIERFEVRPGRYGVGMKLTDGLNLSRYDSTGFVLDVRRIDPNALALSDIELTREMAPTTDTTHPFARGGYILMRNIDGLIGPPDFHLNSYVEIYNADRIPSSEFHLHWLIADSSGRGVYLRDTLLQRPAGPVIFDVNSVVVEGLRSGWYLLAAKVFNGRRGIATDSVEVVRSFAVWNPRIDSLYTTRQEHLALRSEVVDPIYAGMKESELDAEYAIAEYIMGENKRNVWKQLSGAEAKSRFLTQFWMLLDDDLSTPENPFRDDYFKRVETARQLYYSQSTPKGWDSDRGRILLVYGEPDGIERRPSEPNRRPYEIWRYNTSQVEFVFVDMGQTGAYRLVHSTARNEIRYPEWERDYVVLHDQWFQEEQGTSGF